MRCGPYSPRPNLQIRLVVTGDAGDTWTAIRQGSAWELLTGTDARNGNASATVTLPQNVAWRLFTKQIAPEQAEAIAPPEGDPTLAAPIYRMVTIVA